MPRRKNRCDAGRRRSARNPRQRRGKRPPDRGRGRRGGRRRAAAARGGIGAGAAGRGGRAGRGGDGRRGPPETVAAPAPEPPAEARRFEEEHHEEPARRRPDGRSPARVLTALAPAPRRRGARASGAAPKLAPMLPSGLEPVADWLTPGRARPRPRPRSPRSGPTSTRAWAGWRRASRTCRRGRDVDQRIGAAVGAAQGALAGEIATLKETVGQIDLTADARQQLDRLDAAMKGQAAELADAQGAARRHRGGARAAERGGGAEASTSTAPRSRACAPRWARCRTT